MASQAELRVIREDFKYALREMNTYIDVTLEDLEILFDKAMKHASLREKESVPVASVMTREVVTATPRLSLQEAAQLMITHRISGLPVISDGQRLLGILTEADLLRTIGIASHHPTNTLWQTLESLFSLQREELQKPSGTVADLMVEHVVTVVEETRLYDAIALMKKYKIKRLVVCDQNRRLQGIITRSNLIKYFFVNLYADE